MVMRHVIIGGSIAGISAAAAIRSRDEFADIILLSMENANPYYGPLVTSAIENGGDNVAFPDNPVGQYGVQVLHEKAVGLDVLMNTVKLSSGEQLSYDKLLIATGRSPIIPDTIPGIEGPGVFPLRAVEDARRILTAAKDAKHAVVLGGGFVGIKAAISLERLGLGVTIIEKTDRILSEKLDKRGSTIIENLLKREDIFIATNQEEYEIIRYSGAVKSLRLASGRIIDADVIVVAIGTKPNADAFKDAGIRINKGILVQESFQTNIPDVYAAGDVAEFRDVVSNTFAVSALRTNAEEMGRLAGQSMAGLAVKHEGFFTRMNTVEILDVPVTTLGLIDPENSGFDVFVENNDDFYRKTVFKNDIMVGALFVGRKEDAGMYAYLIKNKIPIGKLKMLAFNGKLRDLDFLKSKDVPPC